jgi:hypothetical protein
LFKRLFRETQHPNTVFLFQLWVDLWFQIFLPPLGHISSPPPPPRAITNAHSNKKYFVLEITNPLQFLQFYVVISHWPSFYILLTQIW